MNFLIRTLVNAAALWVAVWLFNGITLQGASTTDKVVTLLVVALIFGVVNAIVGTLLKVLTLPLILLTLGLLVLVINAGMLMLTSWVADSLDIGFHVDGFWTAVGGSIVISLVSMILNAVVSDD